MPNVYKQGLLRRIAKRLNKTDVFVVVMAVFFFSGLYKELSDGWAQREELDMCKAKYNQNCLMLRVAVPESSQKDKPFFAFVLHKAVDSAMEITK